MVLCVVVMKVQMSILNCNRSFYWYGKGPTKEEERMNLLYEFLCDAPLAGSFPPFTATPLLRAS